MIKIGNKTVEEGQHCFIIAGANHNGDIEAAKKHIDAAADAVKFQTWINDEIVTKRTDRAKYQKENWGSDSFYDDNEKLKIPLQVCEEIIDYAKKRDSFVYLLQTICGRK